MMDDKLFTQQQVEQMMSELVGKDAYIDYSQKDLYGKGQLEGLEYLNSEKMLARQLIPSIIAKYGAGK